MKNAPSYLALHRSGELARRIAAARENLRACTLCPWHCRVDRLEGKLGVCKTGPRPVVSSYGPHFGEERPLVGRHGSGTIFLTGCNLHCIFCQNSPRSALCFSHPSKGTEMKDRAQGDGAQDRADSKGVKRGVKGLLFSFSFYTPDIYMVENQAVLRLPCNVDTQNKANHILDQHSALHRISLRTKNCSA